MKAQNLIASIAAVLFTAASLSAVHYNVDARQAGYPEVNGISIVNLPAVHVYASAAEMRDAVLLPRTGPNATLVPIHMGGTGAPESLSLIGSSMTMPYYSFGKKFGSITKE